MACGTDGRNHTSCCVERFVPNLCLPFCAFSKEMARTFHFDLKYLPCAEHLDSITSCMTEGLVSLPSPPYGLTVQATPQTLTIRWQTPSKIPWGTIPSYRVSWRKVDSKLWNDTTVANRFYTIHNLRPDTSYVVQVVTLGTQGSSLPAPRMEARTGTESISMNVTVPADLTECCQQKGVQSFCLPACSGSAIVQLPMCSQDLLKIVQCAADGRDHTPCCKRSLLPDQCLSHCMGDPSADSFLETICTTFTPQILTCFRQGYTELPSQPLNFHADEVGPTSVKLAWDPPKKNPSGVTYRLYYIGAYDSSNYKFIEVDRSPYTLDELKPIIPYTVYLIAVNAKGTSLPTPKIQFVTIANESPMITVMQNPSERYVKQGSVVVLTCVARGQPIPEIKWIRNGTEINNGTLTIGPLTPTDTGRYTCVATNSKATSTQNVFLNVQYAPMVSPVKRVLTVPANEYKTAQLQCEVKGFPESIVWLRDNVDISKTNNNGDRYMWRREVQEERGLIQAHFDISYVRPEDYGMYMCQVQNRFGTHHASITLQDPSKPVEPDVTLPPPVVNVTACCIRNGVRDKCLSICSFDIDVQQLMNMNTQDQTDCLEDGDKILSCAADQRDHTQCCAGARIPQVCLPFCMGVVEQPLPSEKAICLLYFEEIIDCMERGHEALPSPPINLRGNVVDGFIQVWWEKPTVNPDKVQYYDVLYTSVDKMDANNVSLDRFTRMYNVSAVRSYTMYNLTVEARNHYGTSHVSNLVQIQTYEMVPSKPLRLRGKNLDQGQVNLLWDLPEKYSGAVVSYNVYYGKVNEHTHYDKVNTNSSGNHYILKNLKGRTDYYIYTTAVSSHFESKPSNVFRITTGENKINMPGGQYQKNNTVVIPVVSVFVVVSVLLIVGIVLYWYFRVRRVPHQRFKDTVSFENPGYASRGNTNGEQREARAWITGLSSEAALTPSGDLANQQPIKGPIDGLHSGEVTNTTRGATGVPDSSIMKEASDSSSDQGYATLSHTKSNGTATNEQHSYATLDVGNVDLSDGTVI